MRLTMTKLEALNITNEAEDAASLLGVDPAKWDQVPDNMEFSVSIESIEPGFSEGTLIITVENWK